MEKTNLARARLEVAAATLPLLPEPLQARIVGAGKTWKPRDLREVAQPGPASTRLIIGSANYAGQGYRWARAAELLPDVSAANLQRRSENGGFSFPADASVRTNVWAYSHVWKRRQEKALRDATHVIIEAGMPLLHSEGSQPGLTVEDVRRLQNMGLEVALLWHGTDVRLPTRHKELEPFSPYRDHEDVADSRMEAVVRSHHALADELGVPEFVSNPYLRAFRPNATWVPTLADPERWDMPAPPPRALPRVLHIPSSGPMKGSVFIRQAMKKLEAAGIIDYCEAQGIAAAQMPALVAEADIVIDGIVNGQYGVASLEAMLARRVAVAHTWDSVRQELADMSGREVPVVEATPDTISEVVASLAKDDDRRLRLGEEGREFVLSVHSPAAAASALGPFLRGVA